MPSITVFFGRYVGHMQASTVTPILRQVMNQSVDGRALSWLGCYPIHWPPGKPEEVAAIAVYLASDESAFRTGGNFVSMRAVIYERF